MLIMIVLLVVGWPTQGDAAATPQVVLLGVVSHALNERAARQIAVSA